MKVLIAALMVLASILPVSAASCLGIGGTLAVDDEGNPSESAQLELDRLRLAGAGYRPLSVERWGGCIKVTYRDTRGGLVTEYLNPDNLEPVL